MTSKSIHTGQREPAWPRRRPGEPVAVLAHRGGHGPWRENTLEAFAGARAFGADGVELDVRVTSDGKPVVHHDAEVPGIGPVHLLRAEDLPPWVPGLDAALAACAGLVVNVEMKNAPVASGPAADLRVATGVVGVLGDDRAVDAPAHVLVSSFWPGMLAAVREVRPGTPLGLLVHPSLDPVAALDGAGALGCVALHPFCSRVTPELVHEAHERGMAVVTWTVNEPDDLAAVAAAGVDIVISDRVVETLRRLGRC